MKSFFSKDKIIILIVIFLILGCITFALCNAINHGNKNTDTSLNEENTTMSTEASTMMSTEENTTIQTDENTTMSTTDTTEENEKEYSDVKDIIAKYSKDISNLDTEDLKENEKTTETQEIVLNMKSTIDKHLLSIKQAKEQEQKEKEKLLKEQQEAKAKKEAEKKARQEAAKATKASGTSITSEERDLLERLVEAEAGGEPYEGKLAVATVVMNRVNSSKFPNTVRGVIYQKNQFSPVANGGMNKKASAETKKAVSKVLDEGYRSFSADVVYFLNSDIATSKWIVHNRTFVTTIGNHDFYK